ncbi:MAG: prepilin-type N-terminal cleavage/methylation domain-containing protein, partial [Candidatus Beckwithbacteria bacterium]
FSIMKKAYLRSQGFTLLELLVVISIIGILMAIGATSFSTAQKRGRDSRRMGDMKAIQKALEQCYALDSVYPAVGTSISCSGGAVTMNQVPSNPKGIAYIYTRNAGNTAYCACVLLENTGTGNASTTGGSGVCAWSTTGSNFCVSNQQ